MRRGVGSKGCGGPAAGLQGRAGLEMGFVMWPLLGVAGCPKMISDKKQVVSCPRLFPAPFPQPQPLPNRSESTLGKATAVVFIYVSD